MSRRLALGRRPQRPRKSHGRRKAERAPDIEPRLRRFFRGWGRNGPSFLFRLAREEFFRGGRRRSGSAAGTPPGGSPSRRGSRAPLGPVGPSPIVETELPVVFGQFTRPATRLPTSNRIDHQHNYASAVTAAAPPSRPAPTEGRPPLVRGLPSVLPSPHSGYYGS